MNDMFSAMLEKGISWEVELTTRCNSRCVGCSRQRDFYFPNPFFNSQVDLNPALFFKALAATEKIDFILFCGNYGDPLLHPEIFAILEGIRERYGDIRVRVHSNAAFGSEKFWQRLAEYFQAPGSEVNFSLDGLRQSHESFRRGTSWTKAVEGARAFISAGGRAVWKMIEFAHNRDEIEAARARSVEMGFRKFDLRRNIYPGLDERISQRPGSLSAHPADEPQLSLVQLEEWNFSQASERKIDRIECRSLERKNLFLDAYGSVWPCCWIGGHPFRPGHEMRQWFRDRITGRFEEKFNSLAEHDLSTILNHAWLGRELEESWQNDPRHPKNPLPATCARTCGKCQT